MGDILQPSALTEAIRAAARQGTLPHAIIFSGAGDRVAAARYAAAAALCREKERPCLQCAACRKVLRDIHPDVHPVISEEKKELSADDVRALRQDTYIRPNEGERKVYIFTDCEALNERDQNLLLKVVEEGPPYAMFFFCAAAEAALLPTIRSRCVSWKLPAPAEEDWPEDALVSGFLRTLADGETVGVTAYLVKLEGKLKREQLQLFLERSWRVCAQALLMMRGASGPQEAQSLARSLSPRALQTLCEKLKQYAGECNFNVGVGHVLGALAADAAPFLH